MSDNGTLQYISAKDTPRIKQLIYKKYIESRIDYLKAKKKLLTPIIMPHTKSITNYEKLISDYNYMRYINDLVTKSGDNYEPWINSDYARNNNHPENLIHPTVNNLLVRSKAESMIALSLSHHGIPFRYECLHKLSGIDIYPDFTIIKPKTGTTYLWEHFGMMDDPSYVTEFTNKINLYAKSGFIMGHNLICSFENKRNPLSIVSIENTIQLYLE